jgi:tetratricopeptide (TPR) repeat protein
VQDLTELILEGGRPEVAEIMQRVDMYFERDQIGLAVEEAYYAIERVPDYLPVHRRLADILIHQGRTQEAAVKINLVANTYLVRGNVDKAADLFAEVIELWPADTEARLRVIDMMRNQGRVPEALHHYAELADLYYRLMADPEKAMATYEEALEYSRRNNAQSESLIPIFKAVADIERQRLNWRKALSYYERIRELDPSEEEAAMAVVELCFQLGDSTKAVGALDNFMRYLLRSGQADRLVPTLEDQVRRRPEEIPLRQRLAEVYRQQGRQQEAIAQMDALGELLLDAGRMDEAVSTIRKIVNMNPPDVEGYRQLLKQLESGGR